VQTVRHERQRADLPTVDVGLADDGLGAVGVDQREVRLRLAADRAGVGLAGLGADERLLVAVEDLAGRVEDRLDQLGAVVLAGALDKPAVARRKRSETAPQAISDH
jgi:hypothetical protein